MELTLAQIEELKNEPIEDVVRDVENFYAAIELRPDYAEVMKEVSKICKQKIPV